MILEKTHNISTNLKGSVEFGVTDDSSKIFAFLSNFLYTDKERAVMTELCSNALDAHVMLGKEEVPILVHLPTELQKEFRVRDYGPGLSEEQVYLFLTKYGSTSKGDSNEMIGGFGIGSKSPAAVTDTWTINSHFDGAATSYLIHVNERGIPSINKLWTLPTDESGIEVIVPTKNTHMWHTAAKKVFAYYDVMPIIKGTTDKPNKVDFTSSFFGLIKFSKKVDSGSSIVKILMNRRAYNLDLSKIGSDNWFLCGGHIEFDTSSLSVGLSREDLQYDSRTIASIKTRFSEIENKLISEWDWDVSYYTNLYAYKQAANEFKTKHNITTKACVFLSTKNADIFAKNVDFSNLAFFNIDLTAADLKIQLIENGVVKQVKYRTGGISRISISTKSITNPTKILKGHSSNRDDLVFVLRDNTTSSARIKKAQEEKKIPNAILLDKEWFDCIPDAFNKIKASSLGKVIRVKKPKKEIVDSELFKKTGNSFTRILEKDLDKTAPIIYILMTNAGSVKSILNPDDVSFIDNFKARDLGDAQIIFVKPNTTIPKYAITPVEWMTSTYDKLFKQKQQLIDENNARHVPSISSLYSYGWILSSPGRFAHIRADSTINHILSYVTSIKNCKNDTKANDALDLLNKCGKMLNRQTINIPEKFFITQLCAAYPMLKYITGICNNDMFNDIISYIEKCEK